MERQEKTGVSAANTSEGAKSVRDQEKGGRGVGGWGVGGGHILVTLQGVYMSMSTVTLHVILGPLTLKCNTFLEINDITNKMRHWGVSWRRYGT